MTTSTKRADESAYRELERLGFSVDGWISGTRIKTASIVSAVLSTNESPAPQPPVEGLREWFNSFRGDHGKTEWDQLLSILASPSLTAGETTKSDGGEHGGERTRTVQAGLDEGLGPMQAVPQAADACSAPSDPPLEDALGHLGSVLSILAELHPDDRSRALDNALAFYNARRPGAQIEPVAGVTRLVHQWPGPSDPSPTALPGWVENALDRSPATRREILRTGELASQFGWTDTSPTAPDVREAIDREERYLIEHLDAECGIMPGDIEGSFHRIREALLSAQPAKGER